MIEQISFKNEIGTLFLVATPIGNLSDFTFRALETLKTVPVIYAEDMRVTLKLLKHYLIKTPMKSYNEHSPSEVNAEIISMLAKGDIALVSDAGTPGISDPGENLIKEVITAGYNVVAIPGANAIFPALITSGLLLQPFSFFGFLSRKKNEQINEITVFKTRKDTIVIYESPHRIKKTLESLFEVLGNRDVSVARELTKQYETIVRGTLEELMEFEFITKGEYVIVIEGNKEDDDFSNLTIHEHVFHYLRQGYNEKEAMKEVAKDRKISKRDIYQSYKIER